MTRLRHAWVVLFLALTHGATPIAAQSSLLRVGVSSASAGWRPAVQVGGVMRDQGLREAVESGLPLRFRLRIELWEKGFFDRLVDVEQASLAVVQNPLDRSYTVDNGLAEQRVATLAESEDAIRAALLFTLHPRGKGRYYYLAVLDVETLSLSDLEELRRWLRGEARPAVQGRRSVGRAVERGMRRVLVRTIGLPTRRYETRSPTFVLR
jgi:hypothetical protein